MLPCALHRALQNGGGLGRIKTKPLSALALCMGLVSRARAVAAVASPFYLCLERNVLVADSGRFILIFGRQFWPDLTSLPLPLVGN